MDASVAVAIVRNEPGGADAAASISRWTEDGARIVVPSHFWLEVANALIVRRHWPGDKVLQAAHELDNLQPETVELHRGMLILTIDACERFGLTTYDAAYLALAISMDGWLVTLDARLRAAAGARVLPFGPTRLSETPAINEHDVTWPNYKGASAFLAKLRAEAAASN